MYLAAGAQQCVWVPGPASVTQYVHRCAVMAVIAGEGAAIPRALICQQGFEELKKIS